MTEEADMGQTSREESGVRGFMVALGARLREARGTRTQAQVAFAVGLSRTAWVNIEQGRQNITVATLARFAKALGVSPAALLPDSLEPLADINTPRPSETRTLRARVAELERDMGILTAHWPQPAALDSERGSEPR